jgi:hypothetical protein
VTPSSIAITLAAKNTSPEHWNPVQPATYLAIIDIFTTLLTLYALFHGITIHFWTSLLHGTSISDVYDSTSPLSSILAFRWRSKTAWATLFSILSLARGPLFQASLLSPSPSPAYTYTLQIPPLILGTLFSYTSILSIIPLYTNFSALGRTVSLHPLEIARAFGSPLFEGLDGNIGARDIELERGHVNIRYGTVEKNGTEKVLRVSAQGRECRSGEVFG